MADMPSKRIVKTLIAVVALACFVHVGSGCLDELYRIGQVRWAGVVAMVLVHLLILWVQSLGLKFGLDSWQHPISEQEGFSLFVVSSYANLLLPRSGVGTTALYLNRFRGNSLVDYGSVVLCNALLFVLACSSVAALACGLDTAVQGQSPPLWLRVGVGLMLAGSLGGLLIPWQAPRRYAGPGSQLLIRLARASRQLRHSGNVFRIGLVHFVLVFLRALRLQIAFWAMHVDAGFFPVLLASVVGDLAFVIAVTPGALGFREAAIALVASRLGTTVSTAVSVALFDRLVFSLTVIVLAQVVLGLFARRQTSPLPLVPEPRQSLSPRT